MNIELKNIQVNERMSEETNAFTATLYINGKKVGYAKNHGIGGPTDYAADPFHDQEANKLIQEAEKWCQQLPPEKSDFSDMSLPMDLEFYLDILVEKFLLEKDSKKKTKRMATHILFGDKLRYIEVTWGKNWPISKMIERPDGQAMIRKTLAELKVKYPTYKLLNTNIPQELL